MQDLGSRWFHWLLRTPWATFLPLLWLLPFLLSAAIRYSTGCDFTTALSICLGAVFIVALAGYRFGVPRLVEAQGRLAAPGVMLIGALLVVWTFRLWWSPVFAGMPNTLVGVDGGNHALLYQRFSYINHQQYEGFVGLYGVAHWYHQLQVWLSALPNSTAIYRGLRFGHYAAVLAIPVTLALVVYPSVARLQTLRHEALALLLTLPFQFGLLTLLVFPVTQYYQAEGFYAQVFGLYPLLFGWISFGLAESASARLVLSGFWLVVLRFSYGLHVGDVCVALGYLWLLDAREIRQVWLRWAARLFVPVAFAAGYIVYSKLYPLRGMVGYFTYHSVPWVLGGQLLLSVTLLVAGSVLTAAGVAVTAASLRLWRYAGTFGLVNGAITAVYFANDEPGLYYVSKYSLYPIVLVSVASAGPIASVIAHALAAGTGWTFSSTAVRLFVGMSVIAGLATMSVMRGHLNYRALARERYERTKENLALHSHFESRVESFIDQTLRQRKASFGGYYDALWPRMFMTNALHYMFATGPDYNYNRAFERGERMFQEKRGECYFFLWPEIWYPGGSESAMTQHARSLFERRTSCIAYEPRWGSSPLTFCAACL